MWTAQWRLHGSSVNRAEIGPPEICQRRPRDVAASSGVCHKSANMTRRADVTHLGHSQPQYNLFEGRAAGKPLGRNRRTKPSKAGHNGGPRASPPSRAGTKQSHKLAPSFYDAALESANYFYERYCLLSLYDRFFNSHSARQVRRRQIDSITVWLALCFNSSSDTHKARWDHPSGAGAACSRPLRPAAEQGGQCSQQSEETRGILWPAEQREHGPCARTRATRGDGAGTEDLGHC